RPACLFSARDRLSAPRGEEAALAPPCDRRSGGNRCPARRLRNLQSPGISLFLPAGLVLRERDRPGPELPRASWCHAGQPQDRLGQQLRVALQPRLVQPRLSPGAPLPAPGSLDPHSGSQGPVATRVATARGAVGSLVQLRRRRMIKFGFALLWEVIR